MDLQATLDRLVASGAESGLQVAAYRRGRPVAEAYAGVAGSGALVDSFSAGKGRGLNRGADPAQRLGPEAAGRSRPRRRRV
ncbi:hypothetical protein [Streptomyces lavendulae]|uniref:hypothetical protein n=1 Tax=Streptomyces lavendulae TaxID=1914 RepID=UPI002556250E|nr:hypothetical protein [Streptomyces lavendulae]